MTDATLPRLSIRGFRKSYDDFIAVRDVSFDLHAGDILALVGPNGAGKTTTLRAVSGILSPTAGQVMISGHDLREDPIAAKGSLAYVPDDPKLFDSMTIWEHLQFIAAVYHVADWQQRGAELLQKFDLEPKRDALAMELSRGMRQKVAIACAYLHDPPLILLDEPLTGLDPPGIRTMKESIAERAKAGAAVVLSSHLLTLVEDLCTRVLIMVKGEIRFTGTIAEARERFAAGEAQASLEDIFFSATGGSGSVAAPREGAP